jgi:2-methylcitrate dehydratase PrpD
MIKFIRELNWQELPVNVQDQARLTVLDLLGAALAGTLTPISRITADYAAGRWPGEEATILLHGRRASAVGAAFANAYAANGIDIDDCARYTKGHPGVQVVPAALALTESLGLAGAQLLTAVVVGFEVAHRAARIWHDTRPVYQSCGSWGSVACAAVAAHLMELDEAQTHHALGIAEYHAPNLPMMRDIDHPAMVKHGVGWGAMTGITAAELASRGFTGIPCLFGFEEYRDWVVDVGQNYIFTEGLAWKQYACCAWTHAAIRAAQGLRETYSFEAADIARIRVEAFHEAVRLGIKMPKTTEEAQFNLAWPLAAMLVDGEVGPQQILEPGLRNVAIQDLARRVEAVENEQMNELYRLASLGDPRGKFVSAVTIELHDGRVLDSGPVEGTIKFPQQHWDAQGLQDKFRWLAGHVLDEERIDALIELIAHLEQVGNVRTLTALMH